MAPPIRARRNLGPVASLLSIFLAVGCNDHRTTGGTIGPDAVSGADVSGVVVNPLGLAVASATVEVTDGPLSGLTTSTDADGRFTLLEVQRAGGVTLRVSKAGYTAETQSAVPAPSNSAVRVMLWPEARSTTTLDYTLTLTADSACTELPSDARTRRYSATLRGDEGGKFVFTMPLGDADFYPTQKVMWGTSEAADLRIYVASWEVSERWMDDGPIVESLGGARYLAVDGTAVTRLDGPAESLTATFEGTFSYCSKGGANPTFFECATSVVECRSSSHQLRIVPRS